MVDAIATAAELGNQTRDAYWLIDLLASELTDAIVIAALSVSLSEESGRPQTAVCQAAAHL
ncbi:hypothetical protein PENANT_c028G04637 [Penicillium antarcticum]|uniref:Uncharacterized protein n=1 Tax=Penicillium antarcticum TaxID=416450 RepID=A0A1V6PWA0_9EURO|nr:hypothetical protein PENANT_c028G04637 [Penicillium antarcticum]